MVRERLKINAGATPFGPADYVQLACMGRHSVHIELCRGESVVGEIDIVQGSIWFAHDAIGVGPEAFGRLVFATKVNVTCETLEAESGERNIFEEWEPLLLDAAQHLDEATRSGEMEAIRQSEAPLFDGAVNPIDVPKAAPVPAADEFDRFLDQGMDAMLAREYGRARELLERAAQLRPDSTMVQANLARLREIEPDNDDTHDREADS